MYYNRALLKKLICQNGMLMFINDSWNLPAEKITGGNLLKQSSRAFIYMPDWGR